MTFHKLALTTALASVTALAAHAQTEPEMETDLVPNESETSESTSGGTASGTSTGDAGTPAEPELESDQVRSGSEDGATSGASMSDANMPEAVMDENGMITAPRSQSRLGAEIDPVDQTSVGQVLSVVENGVVVKSIDGYVIGKAVAHEGQGGADHLVIVEVSDEANIDAERLGFEVSSLEVERAGGGLQYDYTLKGLRQAVADRVAAESE